MLQSARLESCTVIDEASAFLLLLSGAANDSPYVRNEANRAFGQKKAIFTIRIEDALLSETAPQLVGESRAGQDRLRRGRASPIVAIRARTSS
jgi:hypothetical protein